MGREPTLDAPSEVEGEPRLLQPAVAGGAAVGPTVPGVDDHRAAAQAVAAAPDGLSLAQGARRPAHDRAPQVGEGSHRLGAYRAIRLQAEGCLEGAHGRVGRRPVDAIDLVRSEAELGQPGLQRDDVVALDEVLGDVAQHAVTKGPARAVEYGIRLTTDNAVDEQPPALLERLDRLLDVLVEDRIAEAVSVTGSTREVARQHEALADGRYRWSGVAATERDRWWWSQTGSLLELVADRSRRRGWPSAA